MQYFLGIVTTFFHTIRIQFFSKPRKKLHRSHTSHIFLIYNLLGFNFQNKSFTKLHASFTRLHTSFGHQGNPHGRPWSYRGKSKVLSQKEQGLIAERARSYRRRSKVLCIFSPVRKPITPCSSREFHRWNSLTHHYLLWV